MIQTLQLDLGRSFHFADGFDGLLAQPNLVFARRGRLQLRRPSLAKVVLTIEQYHHGPCGDQHKRLVESLPP
jgi:hypothetical protein